MNEKLGSLTQAIMRRDDLALAWFSLDPSQVARHTDAEKTRLLGLDMLANGQLHAVSATHGQRVLGKPEISGLRTPER